MTASAPTSVPPARASAVGSPRRLALALALLVPVVVDPFGEDTQGAKTLLLSLCGLLALVLGAVEVLARRRRPQPTTVAERLLIALGIWGAVSLLWACNPQVGLTRVALLPGMAGVAIVVRELCVSPRRARLMLLALVAVGAVAMAADAVAVLHAEHALGDTELKHASVLFVHNNMAASYVTLLVPLLVAGVFGARRAGHSLLWGAGLCGLLLYMHLLGSRAGMLGALLAVAVVGPLFLLRQRLARFALPGRRWMIPAVALLAALALLPLSDRARGLAKDSFYRGVHLLSFDLADVSFRPLLWRKTIEMVREHPLRGVGAGNFVVEFPRFEHQAAAKPHAHNDALQVLAELGLPGLLAYLALLGAIGFALLSVICSPRGDEAWIAAAGALGSLVAFVVCGQFEVPFALGATAGHLAVLAGVAGALRRMPKESGPVPERGAATAAAARAGRAPRAAAAVTLLACVPALAFTAFHLPGSWLTARAEARARSGDPAGAQELYARVAALGTGAPVPERMLGKLSLLAGDGQAALEHVRKARALWPYSSELAEDEGDALTALGRHDEAVLRYREALEGSPTATPFFKLVYALAGAGRLRDAVDLLQYRVRTDRTTTLDTVQRLADLWRRLARSTTGPEQVEALVATRHYLAVLVQEGEPARIAELDPVFKDITHRLQVLPGSPASWWPVYERFREQNSLRMPWTALWTSMDGDAHRLFPGYVEPLGPPIPDLWREPP